MRISLCLYVQLRVRRSFGIERAALIFDDFLFEKKKKDAEFRGSEQIIFIPNYLSVNK